MVFVYHLLIPFICQLVFGSTNFFSFTVRDGNGHEFPLNQYEGYVVLVLDTASRCLFVDDSFESLIPLQAKYRKSNFTVLAFPTNEFGGQEPGTNEEIQTFFREQFDVNFPVLAKVNVLDGPQQEPVWKYLIDESKIEPTWNYWKYLIGRNGKVLKVWNHNTRVRDLEKYVKKAIEATEEKAEL